MPKTAILSFSAPETCAKCVLKAKNGGHWYCIVANKRPLMECNGGIERAAFCPLMICDENCQECRNSDCVNNSMTIKAEETAAFIESLLAGDKPIIPPDPTAELEQFILGWKRAKGREYYKNNSERIRKRQNERNRAYAEWIKPYQEETRRRWKLYKQGLCDYSFVKEHTDSIPDAKDRPFWIGQERVKLSNLQTIQIIRGVLITGWYFRKRE